MSRIKLICLSGRMNRLWKKIEDLNVAIVGIGKEMDELKDKVHKYEKEVKAGRT